MKNDLLDLATCLIGLVAAFSCFLAGYRLLRDHREVSGALFLLLAVGIALGCLKLAFRKYRE